MSKVTLKSLNAKYEQYGCQVQQNEYGVWWIVLDGVPKIRIWGRAYVREAALLLSGMDWLDGQSCPLPTVELDNQELQLFTLLPAAVDPTREAIKAASDADGGVDLSGPLDAFQETPERYTVSFRELARIESEKILAARVDSMDLNVISNNLDGSFSFLQKNEVQRMSSEILDSISTICKDVEVKKSESEPMREVSFFDEVVAMNNRVSDADLYDYEMNLQDDIFPEVKPEPQPVPATPLEIMQATDEMSEALVEISKDGFYFDRLTSYDPWAKVETKKFIVYKNGSNFGKLEYDPTFKTWSFRLCVDGDYVYKPEGGYVSARQVRDAMIHHARVPF